MVFIKDDISIDLEDVPQLSIYHSFRGASPERSAILKLNSNYDSCGSRIPTSTKLRLAAALIKNITIFDLEDVPQLFVLDFYCINGEIGDSHPN